VNLAGADLSNDVMSGANFTGTDLEGANFRNDTMYLTNLSGADLYGATLARDNSGGITGTPAQLPAGWKLINGYLVGSDADLTSANLANQDLRGISLWLTTFSSADLTDSNLSDDYLEAAKFDNSNLTGAALGGADVTSATFAGATGNPSGGSSLTYGGTTCPDLTVASFLDTCVGHGFAP
jgi:uncharacterized protein YjbI with pentapeptide repeats